METRMHYVCCKSLALSKGYRTLFTMFNKVHVKICTAQVVYHALTHILDAIREGREPVLIIHFNPDIDRDVRAA